MTTSASDPRGFLRRNLAAVSVAAIAGAALLGWLAFGYFGVQTLFIDDKVDEAGPVFESGVVATETGTATTADEQAQVEPGNVVAVPDAQPDDATATAVETGTATTGGIATLATGPFAGLEHPTEGAAVVLSDGSEQRFLRFEDFATDNGPDLSVYLAPGGDVGAGFVDLGDLKGNIGDQNYEIPADVDLSEFDTVVIWCVRFSVAFGEATLAAT